MASFGPFIFGMLIGWSFAATGSPNAFFYGLAVFYPFLFTFHCIQHGFSAPLRA